MNKKVFITIASVGFSTLLVAGCGTDNIDTTAVNNSSASQEQASLEEATVQEERLLIDVRTPQEYNEGYIEGAININVESPDFLEKISQLDPNETYEVYCRSGRRSAIAVEEMSKQGFSNLVDLGGIDEAATTTQKPVVSVMQ